MSPIRNNSKKRLALTITSIIFVFTAFVLSLLCLFAGRNETLQNYDILTLDTTNISTTLIYKAESAIDSIVDKILSDDDAPEGNARRALFPRQIDLSPITDKISDKVDEVTENVGDLIEQGKDKAKELGEDALNKLKEELKEKLRPLIRAAVESFDLEPFYSLHVLNHCEGNYTIAGSPDSRDVTECSSISSRFDFIDSANEIVGNITDVDEKLKEITRQKFSLEDMGFDAAEIEGAIKSIKGAVSAVIVLYALPAIFAFCICVLEIIMLFTGQKPILASINLVMVGLCFAFTFLSSAVVTGVMFTASNKLNDVGGHIGLNAYAGTKLVALSWSATILVFLVFIIWIIERYQSKSSSGGRFCGCFGSKPAKDVRNNSTDYEMSRV